MVTLCNLLAICDVFSESCLTILKTSWELQSLHSNLQQRKMAVIVSTSQETLRDGDSTLSLRASRLHTCGFELIKATGHRTLVSPSGEECAELVKVRTTTSDAEELSKLWREQQRDGETGGLCG